MKVLMIFNHELFPDFTQEFILVFEDDATKEDIVAEFNESLLDFAYSIEQDYMNLTGCHLDTREEQEEFAAGLTGLWCVATDEMLDTYIMNSEKEYEEQLNIDLRDTSLFFKVNEDGSITMWNDRMKDADDDDWCLEDSTYEEDEDS